MNTDVFKIVVPGMQIICFGGEEAARTFYDPTKFIRKGAVPLPVQKTLTGVNAIHTTDGEQHHTRKEMFMSLMTDENIARLQQLVRNELTLAVSTWAKFDRVVLFEASSVVLCRAICSWAGVPLNPKDAAGRAKQFVAMVDAFGTMGPRHFRGSKARNSIEAWIAEIIAQVRSGQLHADEGSALYLCAHFKEHDGSMLDAKMAAIELINILRPTVAIAWYIAFSATALFTNQAYQDNFISGGNTYRENFINEVRRFFPFAPFMGAKVRETFEWKNVKFPQGALVLLDMYGTNHDDRLWEDPFSFVPERFNNRTIKPFDFLAQGGGSPHDGHRCPGELITVETVKTVMEFLCREVKFELPKQDMTYSLSRMPTRPKDGFIMQHIQKINA